MVGNYVRLPAGASAGTRWQVCACAEETRACGQLTANKKKRIFKL